MADDGLPPRVQRPTVAIWVRMPMVKVTSS
jgi:hypothetical protein